MSKTTHADNPDMLPYDSTKVEHARAINRLLARTDRLFTKVAEHEAACHARNEKDAVEAAELKADVRHTKEAVAQNCKLLWGLIAGMLGLASKEVWISFLNGPAG